MATLTAGTNSTYTGYSDGTLLAAFGSFTGTLGGATVNVVATDSAAPDVIAVYTAAGSFSAVNGKPLEIDGVIYPQASCVDLSFAIYSTYTATGFSFVNTTVYAVDFAVYAGPTYVGVSTGSGGASSVPISFASSGRTAGDRLFIAVMTANQAVPALTGWTVVTPDSGDPFRGTAGAAGGVRCTVLTRVSDGTEGTVTVGDSGDVQYVAGIVVRGDSGADVDLGVSIGGNAAASTSGSFTGVTTDGDNQFILTFVTTDRDASGASWSSQANANLGNLTERFDNGTATNTGGGVAIYTGEKLVAGATGATTATQAASAAYCWITLAVKNAAGGTDGNATGATLSTSRSLSSGTATGTASATGAAPTVTLSLSAGAATGSGVDGNATGASLSVTLSASTGAATGTANATGAALSVGASVSGGAATGAGNASGAALTVTSSIPGGTGAGAASAAGASLSQSLSVSGGAATGNAGASGSALSVTHSLSAGAGSSAGNGDATGADVSVGLSLIGGTATGQGAATGSSLSVSRSINAGAATGAANAGGAATTLSLSLVAGSASATSSNANASGAATILTITFSGGIARAGIIGPPRDDSLETIGAARNDNLTISAPARSGAITATGAARSDDLTITGPARDNTIVIAA